MVFGEGYDNSLWLLLVGDEENRQRLADCIKNMPSEVLEKIQLIIKESEGEHTVYVESTSEYYFSLSIKSGILNIYLDKRDKKGLIGEEFSLSLIPLSKKEILSKKVFVQKYIGWFKETINNVATSSNSEDMYVSDTYTFSKEYRLLHEPFGTGLESFFESEEREGPYRYKRLKIKKIPDNMFVHQLEDQNKLNRLVKQRVKK